MAEAGISGATDSTSTTRGIEMANNPSGQQAEISSSSTTVPGGSNILQEGIHVSPSGPPPAGDIAHNPAASSTAADAPPTLGATAADGTTSAPENQTLRIKIMNATGNPSQNQYIFTVTPPYLRKRGVEVEGMDPFNLTFAQVKDLIWRDWPNFAASSRPESSEEIRLIHFGMYLVDEQHVRDTRFRRGDTNVVHMVIRPRTPIDPNEIKNQAMGGSASGQQGGNGGRGDEDGETRSGCCCLVM